MSSLKTSSYSDDCANEYLFASRREPHTYCYSCEQRFCVDACMSAYTKDLASCLTLYSAFPMLYTTLLSLLIAVSLELAEI